MGIAYRLVNLAIFLELGAQGLVIGVPCQAAVAMSVLALRSVFWIAPTR